MEGHRREEFQANTARRPEIVRDWGRFLEIAEPWERLRRQTPGFTLFQSHLWLRSYWEHCARDSDGLFVACHWEGADLVVAAPLCITRGAGGPLATRVLRFIGAEYADFARILLLPGDDAAPMWALVAAHSDEWEVADLRYVPEDGAGTRSAKVPAGWRHEQQVIECARWIHLSAGPWRKCVKKGMRHSIERHRRRIEEQGPLRFSRATEAREVEEYLEQLADLHTRHWAERGETSLFQLPDYRAWAMETALRFQDSGQLYLCRLLLDKRPIAVGWGFLEGEQMLLYCAAYARDVAHHSPGSLLVAAILDDLQTRGVATTFSFGRGDEEYKRRWSEDHSPLHRHLLTRRNALGSVHSMLFGKVLPFLWRHPAAGRTLRKLRRASLITGRAR
ncbi:MAG TPA: GNAT family N-acetyltransferase [Armatimonadota bacterium]|nr:GNAT family N-acetyltransferase [Armatimonadota bacterium]